MFRYLTLALLLLPILLFSQTNYKKGYVVTNEGDTIQGYIDFRSWDNNPETISFRSSLNAGKKKIGIAGIQYFNINGLVSYRRYTVSVSLDEVKIATLATFPDSSSRMDTVFLKVHQEGDNVSLLSYSDFIKTRYYIQEQGQSTPVELTFKSYFSESNKIRTIRTYINQLLNLAGKYQKNAPGLSEKISTANYDLPDLMAVCSAINNKLLPVSQKEAATAGRISSKSFFIGLKHNMTALKYYGDAPMSGSKGSAAHYPELSVGMNYFPNPLIKRLAFRIELSGDYSTYEFKKSNAISSYHITQSISQVNFRLTPQIIYNLYNTASLQWYLGAGLNGNYSFYPKNTLTTAYTTSSLPPTVDENHTDFEKLWYAFASKTGVSLNRKFEAYLQYTFKSSLTNYIYYQIAVSGPSIGVNYHFPGKKR